MDRANPTQSSGLVTPANHPHGMQPDIAADDMGLVDVGTVNVAHSISGCDSCCMV